MPDKDKASAGILARIKLWFGDKVAREVPSDLETCEFDCRKLTCLQGDWAVCPRRLRRAASDGE